LLPEHEPVIQSARFGVVPSFRHLNLFPTLSLLRAVYATAIAFGADRLVSFVSARPTKLRFWNRIGWRTASEPIAYRLDPKGGVGRANAKCGMERGWRTDRSEDGGLRMEDGRLVGKRRVGESECEMRNGARGRTDRSDDGGLRKEDGGW